jgi:YVTN family beta-propeller protein
MEFSFHPRGLLALAIAVLLLSALGVPAFASGAQVAYVVNSGSGSVSAIDPATNSVARTIAVGSNPRAIATTPDGKTAYVSDADSGSISAIDTATNSVAKTIAVGSARKAIAVSPDGKTAYVANFFSESVSAIDTATNSVAKMITVGKVPVAIAIGPDGKTAYVANSDSESVSSIDTATNSVAKTITVGAEPIAIAVSPDGKTAYVASFGSESVSAIDTATNTVAKTITVGAEPNAIAVSPDGKTAYVANASSRSVSAINTGTNSVARTITVGADPVAVLISPDGKTAYVANEDSASVSAIDTATNSVAKTIAVGGNPVAIAIATLPDQPPRASFTTTQRARPGVPLTFDASASKDPDSPIQSYAWDFGDGESQTLTTAQAIHTFPHPGTYTVSLKETDAEGCSTAPETLLLADHRAFCNGNVGAQVSQRVRVGYPGVQVRCPKSDRPSGCAFKLQAIARRPKKNKRPKAESAVAKANVKAGFSTTLALKPMKAFAQMLGAAKQILVKETVSANGRSSTRYVKLRVVR